MNTVERYAAFVTTHSKLVIALMLVATLVVGAGAGSVDSGLTIASFESDSPEAQALDRIDANFTTEGENTSVVQIVVRGENVLSKSSLLETLRLQQAIRDDPAIEGTLTERQPVVGLANVVATTAMAETESGEATGPPDSAQGMAPLDAQIEHLDSLSPARVEAIVAAVLDPDREVAGPTDPYSLLSTDYEAGATTATGRVLFVFQDTGGAGGDDLPTELVEAQFAIEDLAEETVQSGEQFVFGAGIVNERSAQATGESFALISPIALLLLVTILGLAYRDVLDVLLGLVGVVLVLVWMAGFMGWVGIGVTQILIAVPFLLIGLSIDYALHVVMRYREAQLDETDWTPRSAMRRGLAGVVVAIGAATVTTAVGFASNVVSPITSIQEFGLVSAAGIGSAFLVFGVLLPPLKVELDSLLQRIGFSRAKRPLGRSGIAGRVLGVGAELAQRAPVAVVVVAVLLSAGGGVAATDIDTSIDQVDFLPTDSPDWMDSLPEGLQPGDYDIRENAIYLNEKFVQSRDQSRASFLIEGPVTEPDTLDGLWAGERALANTSTAVTLADGQLRVTGPVETIDRVAQQNETVAGLVAANDPDDDGLPEENLTAIYDAVSEAAPEEASAVFARSDGTYTALRVSVGLVGGADTGTVTSEMREVATTMEGDSNRRVTATGRPIVQELVQRGLLTTLVWGFLLTFVVIAAFLTVIFWRRYETASLGAVVIAPVVLAQAWIFGTMYLAGISFNTETAIVASIGIGIGVDYAIHIGDRFLDERHQQGDPIAALRRTVRGTGGALLGSAISTAGGFAVLMLALVPSLQRFGFVTATAIVYAFLASVIVLPSLLVLWSRYVDRSVSVDPSAE
ncbi:transporter [Halorhabdus sp. CBA1104]|uniref:efflux RND transporter permease subunit n=1 Tax=Halorhabdus sp. CBA1104 TaxID=1380432 RepID=UPI0012B2A903|nr:MMPL family transporter [Halorhabdus sp. CBA1104]QGN07462.1 transporter [Halorhabdus sp. CBA1104]